MRDPVPPVLVIGSFQARLEEGWILKADTTAGKNVAILENETIAGKPTYNFEQYDNDLWATFCSEEKTVDGPFTTINGHMPLAWIYRQL